MNSITHGLVPALVLVAVSGLTTSAEAKKQKAIDETITDMVGKPLVVVEPDCPGPECPWDGNAPAPAVQGKRTIFLNFDGVTVKRGSNWNDDATSDTSRILRLPSIVIPPLEKSDLSSNSSGSLTIQQIKDMIADDVRFHMTPYNVKVVTERPTSGNYHMVVFSGKDDCETVAGTSCAGIAPLDCGDGNPNNLVWVFAGGLRVSDLSTTSSHESAHALGVHHTLDKSDIMYPSVLLTIPDAFGAGEVPDGYDCSGSDYQDSDAVLLNTIGPALPDTAAPEVMISQPLDGLTIGPGSVIQVRTEDQSAIDRVEILLNGELFRDLSRDDRPFGAILSPLTPEGPLTITARAYDLYGNTAETTHNVTFKSDGSTPCTDDDQCFGAMECQEGVCVEVDPNEGKIGWICTTGDECDSGVCGTVEGESRCTQVCDDVANLCPTGFECLQGGACWPADPNGGGGGGCAVSQHKSSAPAFFLFAAIALLGLGRRRRS